MDNLGTAAGTANLKGRLAWFNRLGEVGNHRPRIIATPNHVIYNRPELKRKGDRQVLVIGFVNPPSPLALDPKFHVQNWNWVYRTPFMPTQEVQA